MYAIEMKNITMAFGNFKANDNITLKVKKGEIHALIGENGAGKSTLMSVLFGMYKPTNGEIFINGVPVNVSSPLVANEYGIGMVHQHFKLVDNFTVLENIVLNSEETIGGVFVTYKESREKVKSIMTKYNFNLDLNKKVSNCTVAEQQRIEIIKMLYRDSDILIFDEPTAVLSPSQIVEFLKALNDLKSKGKTIIIISHKLDELKEVAQRGTVIRRGKLISEIEIAKTSNEQLAELMVGTKVVEISNKHKKIAKEPIVKIKNLCVNKFGKRNVVGLEAFDLEINKGEIVAIAGVEGNGQTELVNSITGLQKVQKGSIQVKKPIHEIEKDNEKSKKSKTDKEQSEFLEFTKLSIKKKYEMGMSHIPEDRHKHGMILDMNLIENAAIQDFTKRPYSKFGILNKKVILKRTKKIMEDFDVRSSSGEKSTARTLSGGNQQKMIVGREISKESTFVVIAQPTRGLDVGAITNIHKYILEAKEQGKAILLISYELDEVMSLADRIVVVNKGKKVGDLNAAKVTKKKLGSLMAGDDDTQELKVKKEKKIKKIVKLKPGNKTKKGNTNGKNTK